MISLMCCSAPLRGRRRGRSQPASRGNAGQPAGSINLVIRPTSFHSAYSGQARSGSLNTLRQRRSPPGIRHGSPRSAADSAGALRRPHARRAVAMLQLLGLEFGDIRRKFGVAVAELVELLRHNGGRSRSRPRRCRPAPLPRKSARSPRRARSRRRSTTAGARSGEPAARPSARRSGRGGAVPAPPCAAISLAFGRVARGARQAARHRSGSRHIRRPGRRGASSRGRAGDRRGASRSCRSSPLRTRQQDRRRAAEREDRVPAGQRNAEEATIAPGRSGSAARA